MPELSLLQCSARALLAPLALAVLLAPWSPLAPGGAAASPLAGGAGFGLYFSAQRADLAALTLLDHPGEEVTIEYWSKQIDRHTIGLVLSVFASAGVPHELTFYQIGEYGIWKLLRGGTLFDCPRVNCSFGWSSDWHHVALVHNSRPDAGWVKMYRDGELVLDSSRLKPPVVSHSPLSSAGVMTLGQDQDIFLGGFNEAKALDGVLDEFRVWTVERTQEEIRSNMHRQIDSADEALNVLLRFDEEAADEPMAVDLSGNGNHALLGRWPTGEDTVSYTTSRGVVKATAPRRVSSSAPVYGDQVEAMVVPGGQVLIDLPGWDDTGDSLDLQTTLESLPSSGSLFHVDESSGAVADALQLDQPILTASASSHARQVWYVPGPGFQESGSDTFSYVVQNQLGETASASVRVQPLVVDPPGDRTFETPEDSATLMVLGGATPDGVQADTVITTLPGQGTLYDVSFNFVPGFFGAPPFSKYQSVNLTDLSRPITAQQLPYRTADHEGAVLYLPAPEASGLTERFSYRHVYREALAAPGVPVESPASEVSVTVHAVNDPPVIRGSTTVTAGPDEAAPVEALAWDVDGSFASVTELSVTAPPQLGQLLQADPSGPGSESLQAMQFAGQPVTVIQWASAIPPFSPEWGPAFSSQLSLCPSLCCQYQGTCNEQACVAAGDIWPCGGVNTAGQAAGILGKSSVADLAANSLDLTTADSWVPGDLGQPAFIVVELELELHIQDISIVELLDGARSRSVRRVSVAREYRGNQTDWTVLWEGLPSEALFQPSQVQEVAFSPPSLCQRGALGRFVRVDVDVQTFQPRITAVSVLGTLSPPVGRLVGPDQQFFYKPPAGLHGDRLTCGDCGGDGLPFDSFQVTPSDCLAVGLPVNFEAGVSPPAQAGQASVVSSLAHKESIAVGASESTVYIDVSRVEGFFEDLFGHSALASCSDRVHSLAVLSPDGADFAASGGPAIPSTGGVVALGDGVHSFEVWTGGDRAFTQAELEVWSSFCGVTIRYVMTVSAICDQEADPTECTTNSLSCPSGTSFNPTLKLCEATGTQLSLILAVSLSALSLVGALLLTTVILVKRNIKLRSVLQRLQVSEDDLDLDAPITKAIKLLDRVTREAGGMPDLQHDAAAVKRLLLTSGNVAVPNIGQMADIAESNTDLKAFLVDMVGGDDGVEADRSVYSKRQMTPNITQFAVILPREVSRRSASNTPLIESFLVRVGDDWCFDSLQFFSVARDHALFLAVEQLLDQWGTLEALEIPSVNLKRFVDAMQKGYPNNPYHGPAHAVDVTVRVGALLNHSGIASTLNQSRHGHMKLFAAVIGAVVHDYEHPGVNNAFAVKTYHKAAMDFNDQHVLEMHSLHQALKLMWEGGECCLVEGWGPDDLRRLRDMVISVVLATDMSRHFDILTAVQTKVPPEDAVCLTTDQMLLVLQLCIKVADIGHVMLPMELTSKWVQRLEEEFFQQGDRERLLGLPISPLMDREKPGPTDPNSQTGFLKIMAAPLFKTWCTLFPGCKRIKKMLDENLRAWQRLSNVDSGSQLSNAFTGREQSINVPEKTPLSMVSSRGSAEV